MEWLIGNLILFSVIGVVCLIWWGYGALMWALGWPPDDFPVMNVIGAICSLGGGYLYISWLLSAVNRWEYRKAIKDRKLLP